MQIAFVGVYDLIWILLCKKQASWQYPCLLLMILNLMRWDLKLQFCQCRREILYKHIMLPQCDGTNN